MIEPLTHRHVTLSKQPYVITETVNTSSHIGDNCVAVHGAAPTGR